MINWEADAQRREAEAKQKTDARPEGTQNNGVSIRVGLLSWLMCLIPGLTTRNKDHDTANNAKHDQIDTKPLVSDLIGVDSHTSDVNNPSIS
ncbi:hypothetical protein [Candidatus Tisiphia endosymbiont of Beris chalybata]|uniref:hypothetical protein n=1 Tax=Candidatus Tisiphia endosymbiont of Beris chalybata TaxID=3066262 RepID=UPI00312CA62D